jgi:hypothetical protein
LDGNVFRNHLLSRMLCPNLGYTPKGSITFEQFLHALRRI